jgi:hypothetical protein
MSGACSQGSAASTSDSNGPDTRSCSSANPTGGDDESSRTDSPECPATPMSETWGATFTGNDWSLERNLSPPMRAGADRQNTMPLTFSVAASPAKTSLSPADEPGSCTRADAPTCSSSSRGSQMSLYSPAGMSSLRTFPDFFPRTTEGISPSFSRRWPSSGFTTSPGECWTADTSESPSDAAGFSSLADVLEDQVAPKYFLSPRAAAGILRRAEKRGRTLPAHLQQALEAVATTSNPTSSASVALEAVARTTTTDKAEG